MNDDDRRLAEISRARVDSDLMAAKTLDTETRVTNLERRISYVEWEDVEGAPPYSSIVFAPGGLIAWWRMGDAIDFASATYTGPPYNSVGDHYSGAMHGFFPALLDSSGNGHHLAYSEHSDPAVRVRGTPGVADPTLGADDDGAFQQAPNPGSGIGGMFFQRESGTGALPENLTCFGLGLGTVAFFVKMPPTLSGLGGSPIVARWGINLADYPRAWMIDLGMSGWSGATYAGTTGAIHLRSMYSGTDLTHIEGPMLALDSWHHVAITYDGASYRMYVNGALAGSPVASLGNMDGSGSYFALGFALIKQAFVYWGAIGLPWGIALDEVLLYDHALTASEILLLAAST